MRKRIITAVLAVSTLMSGMALAVGTAADRIVFAIESQPLRAALQVFAKQTGMQVLRRDEDVPVEGVIAPRVTGALSAQEALDRLLANTGFTYEFINDRTVRVIAPSTAQPAVSATGEGGATQMQLARNDAQTGTQQDQHKIEDRLKKVDESAASSQEDQSIQEIVVTAQKREERLQDVPISVGILTGEDLDNGTSRSVTDVLSQVGGVSTVSSGPNELQIAIRGVLSSMDAGSGSVAFYQDETPFGYINSGRLPDINAFDLERVEVLRGPQGTLYGANAFSGVVRIITNDADLDDVQVNGRLRGSSTEGGGENYQGDLAVNLPIIPGVLAVRGVVGRSELSGFTDSTFVCNAPRAPRTCVPGDGGRDINNSKIDSYRLKVSFQPTDELSIELGYSGSDLHMGPAARAADDFTTIGTVDQRDQISDDVYNVTAQLGLPGFSLLSSTSYMEHDQKGRGDLAPNFYIYGNFPASAWSQEFRATSGLDGPWQWSAGAIYREAQETLDQGAPDFGIATPIKYDTGSSSWAVFGELTREFADDRFEVTFGLRYFEDEQTFHHISNLFGEPLVPDLETKFDKLTWRLVGTYKPDDHLTLYGSVATGFRSGRFQFATTLNGNPDFPPLTPDSIINYEVGAKGRLSDTLSYDVAVYYTDWENIQQTFAVPSTVPGQSFVALLNAGNASGAGVDSTLNYQPTDALSLGLSLGWNDLGFSEDSFQGNPSVLLFAEGTRVNESPEWTGSFSSEYRLPLARNGLNLVWSGNYVFATERLSRNLINNTAITTGSDTYGVLNGSVALESEHWTILLFADNALDEDAAINSRIPGYDFEATRARPRTIGLQTNFRF